MGSDKSSVKNIKVRLMTTDTSPHDVLAVYPIDPSTWHFFAYTYDGINTLKIYADGELIKTDTSYSGSLADAGSLKSVLIGKNPNWNGFGDGLIDEVRIYNRALSPEEIRALYQTELPFSRSNENPYGYPDDFKVGAMKLMGVETSPTHFEQGSDRGLVLNLHFDEGEDYGRVYDSSLEHNDGCIYGNTRLLFHFDEGSGSTTADETCYDNDGTIYSATFTTDTPSGSGYALQFDGADDYVEIPDRSYLEGFKTGLTVTAWVKPGYSEGDGITGYILHNNRYHLMADTEGFKINVKNASGTWSGWAGETTSYTAGNWYFIAGRYDPATHTVQMFVNGVAYDTESLTGDVYSTADPHRIGMTLDGAAPFNGTIDEVAIYSKALSDEEIQEIYSAKRAKFTDWVEGKFGKALEFDGVDDYVRIPYSDTLDVTYEVTYLAWVYPRSTGTWQNVVGQIGCDNGIFFYDTKFLGSLWFINDDDTVTRLYIWDNQGRPYNQWYLVTLTYSYTDKVVRLYVNGELINEIAETREPQDLSGSFYIGGYGNRAFFNGTIDEVRIYNRALTPEEIRQLYLAQYSRRGVMPSDLVLYMDFDRETDNLVEDLSKYNNYGTIHGATWVEGKFGKALSFDGVDDYVEVPDSESLKPTTQITVTGWVYLNGPNTYNDEQHLTRKEGQWAFGFSKDGKISGWVHTNGAWRGTWSGGGESLFGAWHFVAYRFRNQRYIDFFVDGNLVWTYDTGVEAPLDTTTNPVIIGWGMGREYFSGTIDEVRIYNRALSEEEIRAHFKGAVIKLKAGLSAPVRIRGAMILRKPVR